MCVLFLVSEALSCRQCGAMALPLAKKLVERTLAALGDGMSFLNTGLRIAASADVFEDGVLVRGLVRGFFLAAGIVGRLAVVVDANRLCPKNYSAMWAMRPAAYTGSNCTTVLYLSFLFLLFDF